MLEILPTEITLTVFSFVPLRQLLRLRQVARSWNEFIYVNESSIYHAAALLHGFIPVHSGINNVTESFSWKDLCIKTYHRERRWEGNGRARQTVINAPGSAVWRFKVDEEQGTVITTHLLGGLTVSAVAENQILWYLHHRSEVVPPYTHCEYAEGFLVLTRAGHGLDVWQRKRDSRSCPRPLTLKRDTFQENALEGIWQSQLSVLQDDRGAFVPWTVIHPPNSVSALRLVHHTLLLASVAAQEAYLYDIPSGTHKQTVSFTGPHFLRVNYVELGLRHIFVCTPYDVHVYPLDANDGKTAFRFPSDVEGFHELFETAAYRTQYDTNTPVYRAGESFAHSTLVECSLQRNPVQNAPSTIRRQFHAVHVTPCGSHFATVDGQGCLCIIRDFETALRNGASLRGCTTIFDLRGPITNLAFEKDKRIAVYIRQLGVFVASFVKESDVSVSTLTVQPEGHPKIFHATNLDEMWIHDDTIEYCSCLQLTPSGLWFSLGNRPDAHELLAGGVPRANHLYHIDFTDRD